MDCQDLDPYPDQLDPPSSPAPAAAPRELFSGRSPAPKGSRNAIGTGLDAFGTYDPISDLDDDVKILDNGGGTVPIAPVAKQALPPLPRVSAFSRN